MQHCAVQNSREEGFIKQNYLFVGFFAPSHTEAHIPSLLSYIGDQGHHWSCPGNAFEVLCGQQRADFGLNCYALQRGMLLGIFCLLILFHPLWLGKT